MLLIVLLGIVTFFALSRGGGTQVEQARVTQPGTSSTAVASTTDQASAITASLRVAQVKMYRLSPSDAGVMLPAIDRQGNVWFGEMATNHLARLDPGTGTVKTWTPPNGESGIMGTTIDTRGNVWFTEQYANYIGRFDPAKQTFQTFSFGTRHDQRVGLQDLQFDATGKVWFTELMGGRIGRLDPSNGSIQTWQVPPLTGGSPPYPFGLALTHDGQVWFGTFTGGVVGHLDPIKNGFTLYHLMNPHEQVYSMVADMRGHIWFTELQSGKLGMIDTTTGKISELTVPGTFGGPEDLHGIVTTPDGDIWFTSSGANALVRYSPGGASYTFFQLPLPGSDPFGLTLDAAGKLWLTAGGGQQADFIGEMTP
jgi:virginiamycin B lyase